MKVERRPDDYETRRAHLKGMSDDQLYDYFWELANQIVDPLLDMAKKYTSPSIERSVLIRMGFSSQEAAVLVDKSVDQDMIQKGCGHLVYLLSKKRNISLREAGELLMNDEGWTDLKQAFKEAQ